MRQTDVFQNQEVRIRNIGLELRAGPYIGSYAGDVGHQGNGIAEAGGRACRGAVVDQRFVGRVQYIDDGEGRLRGTAVFIDDELVGAIVNKGHRIYGRRQLVGRGKAVGPRPLVGDVRTGDEGT